MVKPSMLCPRVTFETIAAPSVARRRMANGLEIYTYTIDRVQGTRITIFVKNQHNQPVELLQRCKPSHGQCLPTTNVPASTEVELPLTFDIEDSDKQFNTFEIDSVSNTKRQMLVLNFVSGEKREGCIPRPHVKKIVSRNKDLQVLLESSGDGYVRTRSRKISGAMMATDFGIRICAISRLLGNPQWRHASGQESGIRQNTPSKGIHSGPPVGPKTSDDNVFDQDGWEL